MRTVHLQEDIVSPTRKLIRHISTSVKDCSIPHAAEADVHLSHPVGGGSAFMVYRGRYQGANVVVKQLCDPQQHECFFWQECRVHQALRHPRLVRCLAADVNRCVLVLQLMPMGSLDKLLFHDTWLPLSEAATLRMAQHILEGMCYLHGRGMLHGNLTPGNIMMGRGFQAKLGGLSCCTPAREVDRPKRCAPPPYLAPEVLCGGAYTAASEVYAFGVIWWEIINRKKAFGHNMAQLLLQPDSHPKLDIPSHVDPTIQQLLRSCLSSCPADRPSFEYLRTQLASFCIQPEDGFVSAFSMADSCFIDGMNCFEGAANAQVAAALRALPSFGTM